ncbi:hypothetical protein RHMOL_Rhmol10G0235400 [Rhododendron molle]|uniref:Uncharacterized protein n=2 Tax=Rhododendron molle TaxID=49168 RepID=A0ACC0M6G5_RHOML|nr:hypothetical protein RHMOL_Rhmol10G0235400 [Rhododendron molle]
MPCLLNNSTRTGRDMAHAAQKSLLKGLGQKTLVPHNSDGSTSDVDKQQALSPVEEDRAMKKQKKEDDNDVNQEQQKDPWMNLPPFQFATWRKLTEKEWKDYNKCLEQSEGFDCGDVPDNILDLPVAPLSLDDPDTMKDLQMYSIFALEKCTELKAEDIAGSGSPPLNFRAKVHSLKGRETVEFCEPELSGDRWLVVAFSGDRGLNNGVCNGRGGCSVLFSLFASGGFPLSGFVPGLGFPRSGVSGGGRISRWLSLRCGGVWRIKAGAWLWCLGSILSFGE